ncbi:MAG: SRPBCC family protein [Candidatus Neomarinimicrobiota bacterium]
MEVQDFIEIAAPPEGIWSFMVEPEKILEWCITFEKFEYLSDQRSGVGTPLYIEERAGSRLMQLNFSVTEWVEHERLAFRMTSGEFVKGYEQSWTVEATPSGSRFTFWEEVKLPYGIFGRIIGLFARRVSAATVKEMLAKLQSLAEA